ncbi:MAG: diaminopimelate decarboxylase [bacterium]|nr:diaminopimelate decarboxylase [bacterium]
MNELLSELAAEHGTPLYVYDLDVVLQRLDELRGFDVVRYAQKANSNLSLLAHLERAGAHVDAVSAGEIVRALTAGFAPERIVYTADVFEAEALELIAEHRLHANLGSADMIEQLVEALPNASATLRVNPGFGDGHDRKVQCGGATSKHGIWHTGVPAALERARAAGVRVRGLHAHLGSGVASGSYERLPACFDTLLAGAGAGIEVVSIGGGLPVPYRAGEARFDVAGLTALWRAAKERWQSALGRALTLEIEPGRYLTAEAGVLLTEVRASKSTGDYDWLLVDAGFHTLARPMVYGAHHRVTALDPKGRPVSPRVVAGPLCESSDVLTQDKEGLPAPQPLPALEPGELLCIHDVGAYGACMASTYNSRGLPAEVLLVGGKPFLVRERQTAHELIQAELSGLAASRPNPG